MNEAFTLHEKPVCSSNIIAWFVAEEGFSIVTTKDIVR